MNGIACHGQYMLGLITDADDHAIISNSNLLRIILKGKGCIEAVLVTDPFIIFLCLHGLIGNLITLPIKERIDVLCMIDVGFTDKITVKLPAAQISNRSYCASCTEKIPIA